MTQVLGPADLTDDVMETVYTAIIEDPTCLRVARAGAVFALNQLLKLRAYHIDGEIVGEDAHLLIDDERVRDIAILHSAINVLNVLRATRTQH
jgi:hypothetical protein